ncbi:MAG: carbohydrate kinase family protein [Streptosporangiaceae bacterium]
MYHARVPPANLPAMCYERIAVLDYLALGNPTLDVQQEGSLVLGGTAVYSALQAARLGLRAAAAGRANEAAVAPYWRPYANEAALLLQPSDETTTFRNVSEDDAREQWLTAWAGEINTHDLPDSDILHIAPIAQEVTVEGLPGACLTRLVCLTPQGLIRRWDNDGGLVGLLPRSFAPAVLPLIDIVVVSELEAPYLGQLLAGVADHGGLSVVTRGRRGCEVLTREGWSEFAAEPASPVVDATGAGDCFAAALAVEVFLGRPVPEAIRLASIAAALSVRGPGPAAIGTRPEIMREFAIRPTRSAT